MNFSFSKVNLHGLKVNNIGQGCVLNFGQSHLANRNTVIKRTQGFGEQNADGVLTINPILNIDDGDIEDNGAFKKNYKET